MHNDPVFGRAVAEVGYIDTVLAQPVMNQVVGLWGRCNESINLVATKVLAIALVIWVGDCEALVRVFRLLA
jgi:hypothetical protein